MTTPYGEDGAEGSYGPAIVYSPAETVRIAHAVSALSDKTVQQRMQSPALADEYPFNVGGSISGEDTKELLELVVELRAFLNRAVARGDGLVFWVE